MTATATATSADGTRIAWAERGAGSPLLLMHGLGYASWGWGPVLEPLTEHFCVLTFDNRGIGGSDRPPGPYTARMLAEDGIAVLDAAGVERAHVVGTSLGGMAAQELALGWPERVERLVLACTTPGGTRWGALLGGSKPYPYVEVDLSGEGELLVRRRPCP
jgi:3-oxoadipate enol-lactonase